MATGCSDDDGTTPPQQDGGGADIATGDGGGNGGFGECTKDRPDWKQCKDGKVQICHIVSGMDPHFHWGADCAALNLSCVNIDDKGHAACVDETKTCAAADEKCDNNTAHFCVNGKLGQDPCGTAMECHVEAGEAPHCAEKSEECSGHGHLHGGECHCDTGYKQDPSDKTKCVSEIDFPTQACNDFGGTAKALTVAETFADYDKAHAELDTVYTVTLPDNKASYAHFEVAETGEFVVFLSDTGVFDTFMHRNETEVTPGGGTANGKCDTVIKDHWHADLTFDGTGGVKEVPFIVRFKAIAGGKTIKFLLKHKDEHDH